MTTSYRVGRSAEPENVDERASNRLDRRDRRNCGCLRHRHSALINAAYLRGPKIGMARNEDSAFEIVRILVVHRHSATQAMAMR
jgi:hypothetical protein